MIKRCENKKSPLYEHYGARGITVCERWHDLQSFINDMGPKPSAKHSLDRIDVNGGYEPGNCRWAEPTVQQSNRRNNRVLEFQGEKLSVSGWSRKLGIASTIIFDRLRKHWSIERTLKTPPPSK